MVAIPFRSSVSLKWWCSSNKRIYISERKQVNLGLPLFCFNRKYTCMFDFDYRFGTLREIYSYFPKMRVSLLFFSPSSPFSSLPFLVVKAPLTRLVSLK